MNAYTFLGLVLVVVYDCSATPHSECPGEPSFMAVTLGNCTEEPCSLKRGSTTKFSLDIKAQHNVANMKAKVRAHAMGTDVDYPLPQDDVCASLINGECPLDQGEVVTYTLFFPVLDSFPAVPCIATFTVVSDQGVEGCMTISLRVVE